MQIGVLGTGVMGQAIAQRMTEIGHTVMLGSRTLCRAREIGAALGSEIRGSSYTAAAEFGEVVFNATPWDQTTHLAQALGDVSPKTFIDCTNPEFAYKPGLVVGFSTSGAEELARLLPGMRIVKALNYVYAELLKKGGSFGFVKASVLYCGDDSEAKLQAATLIRQCGFTPVDAGPLGSARLLEPVAQLMVHLIRVKGMSPGDTGLAILHREAWRATDQAAKKEFASLR